MPIIGALKSVEDPSAQTSLLGGVNGDRWSYTVTRTTMKLEVPSMKDASSERYLASWLEMTLVCNTALLQKSSLHVVGAYCRILSVIYLINHAGRVSSLFADFFTFSGIDQRSFSILIKVSDYNSLHHCIFSSGFNPKILLASPNACLLITL